MLPATIYADNKGHLIQHSPIQIIFNSDFTVNNGVSCGDGSFNNPWIIENLSIDGTGFDSCIDIRQTTDYFIIRNCSLFFSEESASDIGIALDHLTNAIVVNNHIANTRDGIYCGVVNNSVFSNNIIENNQIGGQFVVVENITLLNNTWRNNIKADIEFSLTKYATLCNNTFNLGIDVYDAENGFINSFKIDASNRIRGRPIYYYKNTDSGNIPSDAGQVILANCSNIIVEQLFINSSVGIIIGSSNNITIRNNSLTSNIVGITLLRSSNNSIYSNIIINNHFGIYMEDSTNNYIYHNSFINNTYHLDVSILNLNYLNTSYPSGGNYWDDYNGSDSKSGSSQNLPGSDGIGDTPYTVNNQNIDHYPLMDPYDLENPPTPSNQIYVWVTVISVAVIASALGMIYWRKRRKKNAV
jgi:parallel beta-helix repeat protein